MRHLLTIISAILLFTACSKDDDNGPAPVGPAKRTVIVYMVGENNLDPYMQNDINEMRQGRKQVAASENLVLYVDKLSKTEMPFIAKINTEGNLDTLYRYEQDFYSLCPATEDYGLVLWGHASGWLMDDSVATHRAYGIDTGNNELPSYYDERSKENLLKGKWLNIPSMREAFKMIPMKWKFIMCDCCNMMNVEDAYELRDVTDYLIGRGIDSDLIAYCIQTGRLFESKQYHNAVFVGKDMAGCPRYINLRGVGTDFKGEASGSDKRYSFNLPSERHSDTLHLFESAIDLLSYATVCKLEGADWRADHLLSLAGVYRPRKELTESSLPLALKQYLKDHPGIHHIVLRLDNDYAGRTAASAIQAMLADRYDVTVRSPPSGKDYNDYLCIRLGKPVTTNIERRSHNER